MACVQGFSIFLNVLMLLKGIGVVMFPVMAIVGSYTNSIQILLSYLSFVFLVGLSTVSPFQPFPVSFIIEIYIYGKYILIALGALTFLIAIWGIVAAAKTNKCLLGTAVFILVIILAVEVVLVVFLGLGFVATSKTLNDNNFDNAYGSGTEDNSTVLFKATLGSYELEKKCCGINGPKDYENEDKPIPESCCLKDGEGNIDLEKCRAKTAYYIHTRGCEEYAGKLSREQWVPVGIFTGLAAITLLTLMFNMCVCCKGGKEDYDY